MHINYSCKMNLEKKIVDRDVKHQTNKQRVRAETRTAYLHLCLSIDTKGIRVTRLSYDPVFR